MSLRAPPGRSANLEAVASVLEPPFGLALLRGEPGMGKGQLADAWRATAATRGFLCGGARVPAIPDEAPVSTLSAALHDALGGYERRGEVLQSLADVTAPERVRLGAVQDFMARPPPEGGGGLPFPWERLELDRVRALEAMAEVVRRVARVRPLALVLRGFEAAPPLLTEFLDHVLAVGSELPLAVLLTMEATVENQFVTALLRSSAERHGVRFVPLELGPLDRMFLEEALASRYPGATFTPTFRVRILEASAGNPGRLGEVCMRLEEAGILSETAGTWAAQEDRPWPFPEEPEEYRLSPVLDLAPPDFELVEFLSGCGGGFPEALLADPEVGRYLGVAERPARKATARLEAAGLIQAARGGFAFKDSTLMRALRQEAEGSVRVRDLQVLAEALPRIPGLLPDFVASLLREVGDEQGAAVAFRLAAARHEEAGAWLAAGQAYRVARELDASAGVEPDLEEQIEHRRREGNAWHVAGRHAEAVESYTAALVPAELLDMHGRLAGLLCRRGACHLELGDTVAARADFDAAIEAATQAGSPKAQRLAVLGAMRARRRSGDGAGALELRALAPDLPAARGDGLDPWLLLEEAQAAAGGARGEAAGAELEATLASLPQAQLLRCRSLLGLAATARERGDPVTAFRLASEAIGLAHGCGDARTRALALELRATQATPAGEPLPEGTLALWNELARLAGRLGEDRLQRIACLQAGEAAVEHSSMELAVDLLGRAARLAARQHQVASEALAQNLLGIANLSLNKLYEAQADFEAAGKLCGESGDALGLARSLLGLGRVYARQRKKERARETLARARDAFQGLGLGDEATQCGALLQELG